MPGIVGIIGTGNHEPKEAMLRQMVQCMEHEPYYTSGKYADERMGVHIGWTSHRGSFSDGMPIWNEKKDVCLIFTGEDFTDSDEIDRLKARGHECGARDPSYLVHLYEEMGDGFFQKLNGRFSGVIVDGKKGNVVLFNDRYGLNRLYFYENKAAFYFSSEAKALLRVLPELRRLDLGSLAETFSYGCVLQNRTLFKEISLIPGASAWRFFPGQAIRRDVYFRPKAWENQEPLSSSAYYDRLRETWIRILPRYLREKGHMAVSLTGGKDSRLIMAWAQAPPGNLPCYTFGGMYRDCEDVKLARQVARICEQPHQVITVDKTFLAEFRSLAERTVYLTDGAMDVTGSPDLYVNRIARQIAPIRLTGNYGQEILRGAIAFKPMPIDKAIVEHEFGRLIERTTQIYNTEREINPLSFVAFKQVPWHHYSRLALELSQLTLRSPFLDNDLVALVYRAPEDMARSVGLQLRLIAEGNSALGMIRTDRGVLYKSIPILTKIRHLYKEFTFKAEYAYGSGMPHWLANFDHVFKPLHLERLFLGRHKFYHFRVWYRDQLSEYIKEVLLDTRTRHRSYLNGQQVERMVMDHIQGTRNYTMEIHRILTSELIQRQFID